jgi:hypothetical protein
MASRRGAAEMLPWLIRLAVLAVAVIIIVLLVVTFRDREIDASNVQIASTMYRLYYGDTIMAEQEGRAQPGIVDMQKVAGATLGELYGDTNIGVRIIAKPDAGCAFGERTVYANEQLFLRYFLLPTSPTATAKRQAEELITPATLVDGTARCPGTIAIAVARGPI